MVVVALSVVNTVVDVKRDWQPTCEQGHVLVLSSTGSSESIPSISSRKFACNVEVHVRLRHIDDGLGVGFVKKHGANFLSERVERYVDHVLSKTLSTFWPG